MARARFQVNPFPIADTGLGLHRDAWKAIVWGEFGHFTVIGALWAFWVEVVN